MHYLTYLRCTTKGHHKHYFIGVRKGTTSTPYEIMTAYGPIGSATKAGKSDESPTEYMAMQSLRKLVQEKKDKGYVVVWDSGGVGGIVRPMLKGAPPWFFDGMDGKPITVSNPAGIHPVKQKKPKPESIFAHRKKTAPWSF